MNPAPTFRDPSGTVSITQDRVIRTVFPAGLANLNACLNSAAARSFVESGTLIATTPAPSERDSEPHTVHHPRIPFISYPGEWPPAMLHAAAALTLDLCEALLPEGLGLKDATPSNILFRGPTPVFIDVLSIEPREPLDPIWLPYAQFARTFLIPLLLNLRTGYPLNEIFVARRDGIPPQDAVRFLPMPRRMFYPDLGLVTLPARARIMESDNLYKPRRTRDAGEAKFILGHRFRDLRKQLTSLAPASPAPSLPPDAHDHLRRSFVEKAQKNSAPKRVLNIGAHPGESSLLAAANGASVVSIDKNPDSVAALWHSATAAQADILPLVVDFARPTPSTGWRTAENLSFLDRAENAFDCVLLLNSMHHFMVADQIPADQILEVIAGITTNSLIVEYIGPTDPAFHRLARGRDALYANYHRTAFETVATRNFRIADQLEIPSADRAFYLLQKHS